MVCLLALAIVMPLMAEPSIEIDVHRPQQKITMMGADMERSANALQHAKNKDEIFKWVFLDTEGVNYLRVVYDKHQELEQGTKDFGFYKKQVASMLDIKKLRPDIRFWATLRTDYDGYGTRNNLPDWIYKGGGYDGGKYDPSLLETKLFAGFIVDFLEYMQQQEVPIRILTLAKEWKQVASVAKRKEVIAELKRMCAQRKVQMPYIVGPATWSLKGGINDLRQVQKVGNASDYAGFSTHQYNKGTEKDWETFIGLANAMGKPAYDDESHTGGGGRTYGEEVPVHKLAETYSKKSRAYRAGLEGEVFFENWSRGINSETRSIYFKWGGKAKRMRAYWLFKHFASNTMGAHYIPSRTKLENVETMCFRKDDSVTLWILNPSERAFADVPLEIKGDFTFKQEVQQIRWSDADKELQGTTETLELDQRKNLTVDLKPGAVQFLRFEIER
ncbi:hypothetical protein ACFPK9_08365 [Rubritalea spongiae]|uniref:hypothetical protein n=1 Tax=Rubritalea spongiae TaxID=430797 RepID=UPI0036241870